MKSLIHCCFAWNNTHQITVLARSLFTAMFDFRAQNAAQVKTGIVKKLRIRIIALHKQEKGKNSTHWMFLERQLEAWFRNWNLLHKMNKTDSSIYQEILGWNVLLSERKLKLGHNWTFHWIVISCILQKRLWLYHANPRTLVKWRPLPMRKSLTMLPKVKVVYV